MAVTDEAIEKLKAMIVSCPGSVNLMHSARCSPGPHHHA
jgi:hypothetical protein